MSSSMFRDVRERFRQAESKGWFIPGATSKKYPLSIAGVSLEGKPSQTKQKYGEAAVLFVIGCKAQSRQLLVLITKRSTNVGSHPGEYCLPGGMYDSALDKSLVDTAFREAREEVGLDSCHLETVSVTPPFLSGWLHTVVVTPVIVLLHPAIEEVELCENHEVGHTLWVPMEHFVISDYHTQLRGLWRGLPSSISSFHFTDPTTGDPCNIWGLTAAICIAVSSIALAVLPHYPSYCEAISSIVDGDVYTMELAATSPLPTILQKSKL